MDFKKYIEDIKDFPEEGIIFRDVTPLLKDKEEIIKSVEKCYESNRSENIKGYINKEIEKINIKDRVIITGFVDKNTLAELYEISDANIVVSKSEGFGLSIIEAGYFGLPTIMYKDLDAYEDVYFKGGFTIVENREDKNVKDAIIETFNTDWNKNFIKREVEKNKKDLKNQYIRFYNDAIKECVFLDINKIVKEVNCFENEI